MYNEKSKWNHAASNLPEGNFFLYILLRMQNKISLTAHYTAQLKKSKIVQRYALDRHHSIPLCRVANSNRIFNVPNGTTLPLINASWSQRVQISPNQLKLP